VRLFGTGGTPGDSVALGVVSQELDPPLCIRQPSGGRALVRAAMVLTTIDFGNMPPALNRIHESPVLHRWVTGRDEAQPPEVR